MEELDFKCFNKEISGLIGAVYYKYFFIDDNKPLVISFAPMGAVDEANIDKGIDPWGFSFLVKQDVNVLCFCTVKGKESYYRDPDLIANAASIGRLLPDFPERIGYGFSMGGYGVSAYADVFGITRLLLINPISTRKKEIATWDIAGNRSLESFENDWVSDYNDGATTKATGFVVYDPLFYLDKMHAIRFKSLRKLKVPGLGHGVAGSLQVIGILTWLVKSFISDNLDEYEFYSKTRARRNFSGYYKWMVSEENKYITPLRKKIINNYRKKAVIEFSQKKQDFEKYKGFNAISKEEVNAIRDAAILLEKIDINLASNLMNLALEFRPNGPFIKQKTIAYNKILN